MITPINNRVVVKREKSEEKTSSGIILPGAKNKQEIAIVVAIPLDFLDTQGNPRELPIKVGDKILLERYAGQEITLDGEDLVIVKADDIVAIIYS